jgi:hypothetical protein
MEEVRSCVCLRAFVRVCGAVSWLEMMQQHSQDCLPRYRSIVSIFLS